MLKTWFKSTKQFTEEEMSYLSQNNFVIDDDKKVARYQKNDAEGPHVLGEVKTLTKYDNFFVSYSSFSIVMAVGILDAETQSFESEQDYQTLEEAVAFFRK